MKLTNKQIEYLNAQERELKNILRHKPRYGFISINQKLILIELLLKLNDIGDENG